MESIKYIIDQLNRKYKELHVEAYPTLRRATDPVVDFTHTMWDDLKYKIPEMNSQISTGSKFEYLLLRPSEYHKL
jgi:hypothetical protein